MDNNLQQLLQISAKLYQLLGEIPRGDHRDDFIQEVNRQLDERGYLIDFLVQEGFKADAQNKLHMTLMELDKGIQQRLSLVMETVKNDLKQLQNSKKNEKQYINPYSSVRIMDGMYYDKKK